MLPPFVPPSARAAAETLPLITDFVVDRVERSFGKTFVTSSPSEKVEVVQRADTVPSAAELKAEGQLPSIEEFVVRTPAPVVDVEEPEAVAAAELAVEAEIAEESLAASPVLADAPSADWVGAERDAFDWQSVAQLAPQQDDARRADDEWTTTDWDAPTESRAEHIAQVLTQLARRVRSGELKVEARRGASVEATVASVLAALLTDPEGSAMRERDDR